MSLPSSIDAERSILGAILLDNGCIADADVLTMAHFSLDSHRRIYKAILEMWADGIAVDIVTLGEFMGSRKQLEAIGGYSYLASLTDGIPPRANILHYVKIVLEKAQLRGIINLANRAIARALEQTDKPADILGELNAASVAIATDTAVKDREIFLDVSKFIRQYHREIEWRVHGVIEVGTNGVMVAMPKAGKSYASLGLAVSLASGAPWLEFPVRRARTAVVSREDYPGTTARRISRYIAGNNISESDDDLAAWLWVSSRAQLDSLLLDNPSDLRLLINNLKRRKIEFCILDVLNVLHGKDENDPSEMRQVMRAVDHIRNEVGCQLMVIHHAKKQADENASLTEMARGAGSIGGFAEFLIGIHVVDEEKQIRKMRFETKAAESMHSICWSIRDLAINGGVKLEREEWEAKKQPKRMAV